MKETEYLEESKKELGELINKINDAIALQRLTVIITDYLEKKAIS